MGQQYQAYIIAKVTPYGSNKPNYRCIGALHHQWCYGDLALKAALRFMNLVRQKGNAGKRLGRPTANTAATCANPLSFPPFLAPSPAF
ncbi:hypothetical protein BDN72DRAFT_460751 [Pluteus cervinus]|uniref:Uncharacterized protein n=1 Tax=Pluteus cervinus TaxID=181527 RepID=A0ACD3A758_9AGAR|nr:hypothetical protein BDN72DRAFT_460751 [Pluteus cervinus]